MGTTALLTLALVLMLVNLQPSSAQWTGNFASKPNCTCVRERVCANRFWGICCTYKYIWKTICNPVYFCKGGWGETSPGNKNCNRAICNPPCQNGGTCIRPNTCQCLRGYAGLTCSGLLPCDVRDPCFPGTCPGNCNCTGGFMNVENRNDEKCLRMMDSERPQIWKCSASLKYVERASGESEFEYVTDSSNPAEDEVDSIWVNFDRVNYLAIDGFAIYEPQLPAPPAYIPNAALGVIEGNVTVRHTKIARGGGRFEADRHTYPCNATRNSCSTMGGMRICSSWNCSVMHTDYTTSIDSGDEISVAMGYRSGGAREIDSVQGTPRNQQKFQGVYKEQTLIFKFDIDDPTHPCQNDTRNCQIGQVPLYVGPEFTKDSVTITWNAWQDKTSGMFRYVWEVFRLDPNGDGELQELQPLSPLNNISASVVNHSERISFPTYTPPKPGRYSVVLQAADAANNSLYVRQVFLYDRESSVDLDDKFPMTIAEARRRGSSYWVNSTSTPLTLSWDERFVNKLHEKERFLGPVLAYPRQFADAEATNMGKAKFIVDETSFAGRQPVVSKLPNKRGVKQFQVQKTTLTDQPSSDGWTFTNLSSQHTFPDNNMQDGGVVTLWVRAEDYMQNRRMDSIVVRFDSSPPTISDVPTPTRNVRSAKYAYASRLDVSADDQHSGVVEFELAFKRSDNNQTIHNVTIVDNPPVKRSQCGPHCTCITDEECYPTRVSLDLDNCWLQVSRENVSRLAADVYVTPINAAGLRGASSRVRFDRLPELAGLTEFTGPTDIRVVSVTDSSVTLNWTNLPTCFEVTEWWVAYDKDGVEDKSYVDKRESVFRLTDLSPATNYDIHVITGYAGIMSRPATISVTTAAYPGMTGGQVAGAVVGGLTLFIILIVIIVCLLYSNGLLFTLLHRKQRSEKLATMPLRKGPGVDDDLYIYGGGTGAIPLSRQVSSSRLTLQEVIKEGNFARIYKASLETDGQHNTVVAKMLREDRLTEEDQQLMLAKIGFQATALGSHNNILQFLGAVLDNDTWGPVMLLEYCENDTLHSWLTAKKSSVTDDVLERLFHFAYGIVRAMEYLSSLDIVHTRLAARNVYLTFVLEVKVASLGPTSLPEQQAKERLPVRWLPPECSVTLQDANQTTDVWSFGVTLWEIFSMGEKPYNNVDAHNIVHEIKRGYRLPRPEYCDEFNYAIMQKCWNQTPEKRPSFMQLLEQYQGFMSGDPQAGDYTYGGRR